MTRCEEFYQKVEKDGNFCGMSDGEYRRLQQFKEFKEDNLAIARISEGAARVLISEPNEEVKAKAIEKVGKALEAGEKVTGKIVKELLRNSGHVDKVEEERIPTEKDKQKVTEEYVTKMIAWSCDGEEIIRRVQKELLLRK